MHIFVLLRAGVLFDGAFSLWVSLNFWQYFYYAKEQRCKEKYSNPTTTGINKMVKHKLKV